MQAANREQLLDANVIIRPALGNHLSDDFTDLDSLIAVGEASAKQAVAGMKALLRRKTVEATNIQPDQSVSETRILSLMPWP